MSKDIYKSFSSQYSKKVSLLSQQGLTNVNKKYSRNSKARKVKGSKKR